MSSFIKLKTGLPDFFNQRMERLPMLPKIPIDQAKIKDFCCRNHIRKLALFGSVLRDDFGPASDVDVLVEFEAGHVPGLGFFALQEELTGLLGRKVDLHTLGFLSHYFRDEVIAQAQVQYAA